MPVAEAESGSTADPTTGTIHPTDLTMFPKVVHSITARLTTADSS